MSKPGGRLRRVETCFQCGKRMRRTVLDNYQYKEGGLSNVYLSGVVAYNCVCGEEVLELPKIVNLHSLIVQKLLTKSSQLKGSELRFIRKFFGLKAVDLAKMLGVDPVTVSRWETEDNPIGPANDKLIRFSITLKMIERLKQEVTEAHRRIADEYLDFLNEINALKTREGDDERVRISSEELKHPRLVFETATLPTVQVEA